MTLPPIGAERNEIASLRRELHMTSEVIQKLCAVVARLDETVNWQTARIVELSAAIPPPSPSFSSMCSSLESADLNDRRKNLLIVGLNYSKGGAEDRRNDQRFVETIMNDTDVVDTVEEFSRYGSSLENLKICFANRETPRRILREMRSRRLFAKLLPPNVSVQLDLTAEERDERRFAVYESRRLNAELGVKRYTVSDDNKVLRLSRDVAVDEAIA